MAENDKQSAQPLRHLLSLPTLSLLVASLSLASSISQNFAYQRSIESVQRNVLRSDNLRTCREIIEVFFAYRVKAEEANRRGAARVEEAEQNRRELKALAARFGAIATHLANFTPQAMRARYTALFNQLNTLGDTAAALPPEAFARALGEADAAFNSLNEDCVSTTQFTR